MGTTVEVKNLFAEIPALTTWAGAAIVIGATLYTIRKNARTTVPPPATA